MNRLFISLAWRKTKGKKKSLSVLIINVCIILSEDNRQDKNCIEYSSVIQTKMKALAKEYNIDPCYTAPSHAKKWSNRVFIYRIL